MLAIPALKSPVNATNTCGSANYGNNTEVILAIPVPKSRYMLLIHVVVLIVVTRLK